MVKLVAIGTRVQAATVIFAEDASIVAECGDLGFIEGRVKRSTDLVVYFPKTKVRTFCGRDELNPVPFREYPVPCLIGT